MTFLFVGSQVCRGLPPDAASRGRPCLRLVVGTEFIGIGSPTGDLHPISSRPCRAYTLAVERTDTALSCGPAAHRRARWAEKSIAFTEETLP